MRSIPNQQLAEWVRKQRVDLTPDGLITRLELWHVVDGEGGTILATFMMEDRPENEDPDDLVAEIWGVTEDDASTRTDGSYQIYALRAFRADDTTPEITKRFRCDGRLLGTLVGTDSLAPTPRGAMGQELRHTENLHAMMIQMAKTLTTDLERRSAQQANEIEHLQAARRQSFELEQRYRDREHERQLEREERAKKDERTDQLLTAGLGMLSTFGPIIMQKVLASLDAKLPGGIDDDDDDGPPSPRRRRPRPSPMPPSVQGAVARDQKTSAMLEGLTREQIEKIARTLSPEQQLGFLDLYKSYSEASQNTPPADDDEDDDSHFQAADDAVSTED
jgi:hypothetical protein